MKKKLLLAVLCAASLPMMAQTIDNPLPLNYGENEMRIPGADEPVYFRYIPSGDEIVTITSDTREFYCMAIEDGKSLGEMYNWFEESSTENIFLAHKDKDYVVSIEADGIPGDILKFNVSASPYDLTLAMSCENPLQLGPEPQFMPLLGLAQEKYTYATYTPATDCTLEIVTDWYPWHIEYSTSCDSEEWVDIPSLTSGSSLGAYRWLVDLEKDTRYIFRLTGPCSTKIWVHESTFVEGESCERPFTGHTGLNKLPTAAGTYYYLLYAPQTEKDAPDNFIEIRSSANLKGGSITLAKSCDDADEYTVFDNFALRKSVISKQPCFIRIEKGVTNENEVFEIGFASPSAYDDFYTAYAIIPDVKIQTPEYPGTYYYMVNPVDEEGMVLTITSDYQPKGDAVSVGLSDMLQGYGYVATGETSLKYTAMIPGKPYIITWRSSDEDCAIPFTVNIRKGEQGETAYWPFDAVKGENSMKAGESQYYRFTGNDKGWVNIFPAQGCPEPSVKMSRNDVYNPQCIVFPIDGGYRVLSEKNRVFTFCFPEVPEGAKFTLTETPLAAGESMEMAVETDGDISLNGGPGVYWFKYQPAEDSFIEIDTDLKQVFGRGGLEGFKSGYTLYRNTVDDYVFPEVNWTTGDIAPLTFSASTDCTYYLEINLVNRSNDVTFSFKGRPVKPGELSTNPIVIENKGNPTEYSFPMTEYNGDNAVWYMLHLLTGDLELLSDGSIKVEVYPSDDISYDAMLTSSGYLYYDIDTDMSYYGFGHENGYYPVANIPAEGDYLLKLKWCDPVNTIFSGTALGGAGSIEDVDYNMSDVKVTVVSGSIVVAGETDAEIYRTDGVFLKRVSVNGVASIAVEPGMYIVRTGIKTTKVVVN